MTRSAARVTSSGFGSFTCGYEQEHHQRGHALVALPGAIGRPAEAAQLASVAAQRGPETSDNEE